MMKRPAAKAPAPAPKRRPEPEPEEEEEDEEDIMVQGPELWGVSSWIEVIGYDWGASSGECSDYLLGLSAMIKCPSRLSVRAVWERRTLAPLPPNITGRPILKGLTPNSSAPRESFIASSRIDTHAVDTRSAIERPALPNTWGRRVLCTSARTVS